MFVFWLICFSFLSIHSWFILGEFYSSTNNYCNTSFFSIFPSNIYLAGSSPHRKRLLVTEFCNFLKQWKISTKLLDGNIFQLLLQSHGFHPFFITVFNLSKWFWLSVQVEGLFYFWLPVYCCEWFIAEPLYSSFFAGTIFLSVIQYFSIFMIDP